MLFSKATTNLAIIRLPCNREMGTGAFARACRPFRACIPAFSAIFDGIASQRTGRAGQAGLRLRARLAEPAGKGDAAQLGVLAARSAPELLRGSRVPLPSNLLGQCSHFSALSSPLRLARWNSDPWPPPALVSRPACPALPTRAALPAITPTPGRLPSIHGRHPPPMVSYVFGQKRS